MVYIVLELQINGEQVGSLVYSYTNLRDAEHKFYIVAAAAVVSNVQKHSVVLLNADGFAIKSATYEHMLADEGETA